MKYVVLITKDPDSDYCAHSPDIDLWAVGITAEEALTEYREALRHYLELMRSEGLEPPSPSTVGVETIEVA